MKITELKNDAGATIYHVVDGGCIQEFWTYKDAQDYVHYISQMECTQWNV